MTEVSLAKNNFYKGVSNNLDDEWKPYMASLGYKLINVIGAKEEADAYWSLN